LSHKSAPFIEPLMGWTGSADPMARMRLVFPSREAAIAYAIRHKLDFELGAAEPVGACAAGSKPQSQPMPLWPVEPSSSQRRLPVPDLGVTGFVRNLAA
jgi:ETC complex I subunit conserved region